MLHAACVGAMANTDVARFDYDRFDAAMSRCIEEKASPGLLPASRVALCLPPHVIEAEREHTTPPVANVPRRRCLFQDHVRSGGPRSCLYCKE